MKSSYFLRGSGGQGIQVVGMMMLHAMDELGGHATFFPEYGSNKRGGFSQCAVMTSDEPIGSFTAAKFDTTVVMNEDSFEKYKDAVKPGGTLVVNTSLIKEFEESADHKVVGIPFDDLARGLGSQKVMNTLLFGFLVAYKEMLDYETAEKIVMDEIGSKPQFRELNLNALSLGFEEAAKLKG